MKKPLSARVLMCVVLMLFAGHSRAQIITSFASGLGDCRDAVTYGRLYQPNAIAFDLSGNLLIADNGNRSIRKVDHVTGIISVLFPNSALNINGQITGMAIDISGNLYLAQGGYCRIDKVDPTGNVTIFAGTGSHGFSGDGSQATAATLDEPTGIYIDGTGNIYVADEGNGRIRKVTTDGIINTIAGGGPTLGDGGPAILASLNNPNAVTMDATGNIYITDRGNDRIRKISTSGIITTFTSSADNCKGIDIDAAGNIYFGRLYSSVYKCSPSGIVSVLADASTSSGFSGDGGPATAAQVNTPVDVKLDAVGNVYIADYDNNRVRKVNTLGIISTVAGNGLPPSTGFDGDGGQSLLATFYPAGIASDRAGNLYVADAYNQRVRKISTSGVTSTIAGVGIEGFGGDGTPATAAILGLPSAVIFDYAGNMYIGDVNTNHIRKVNTAGIISTIAGGGTTGLGDGGPATTAQLSVAYIASDSAGNIYIADASNQRIRKIDKATNIITTICGNGTAGFTGDGGAATAAQVHIPRGITIDNASNIYFADQTSRIRKINAAGLITTVAGGGAFFLDGGPATAISINVSGPVTTDKWGNVYFTDNSHVDKIDGQGYLHIVAGKNGISGYIGDCGDATAAELSNPQSLTIDTAGNLYILDGTFIRQVCCMTNTTGNPPVFTHGNQSMQLCASSPAISIDTFLTMIDADAGNHIKWSVYTAPTHGTLGGFVDSVIATGSAMTPSGTTYTPGVGYSGTDNFIIKVSDGNYSNYMTIAVTVSAMPTAITGTGVVCAGNTINLIGASGGGTWSSSNTAVATAGTSSGIITGVAAGTSRITYTLSGLCSINTIVTVNNAVAPITGTTVICMGMADTLICTATGGTWNSSNTGVAGIGTGTGIVNPNGAGTTTVSYTLSGGCRSVIAITVNPLPNSGSISGASAVCAGSSTPMSDGATGGAWSVSNSNATVGVGGSVTGVTAGVVTVSYTVTNSCGTANSVHAIAVNPLPSGGTITGTLSLCTGNSAILSDPTAIGTGVWSCADPYIGISSASGIVTGIAAGMATVSYSVSNSCGSAMQTAVVTVNGIPWAGTISGITSICTGGTSALSSTVAGGSWISGNPFVATVGSTGVVTGVAGGAAIVSYILSSSGCGTAVAVAIVNVGAATTILPVTGVSAMCTGTTATLTDGSPGGTWSSSNTSVATVGSTGVVTAVAAGVATISYSANLGCGVSVATSNMTVHPAAAAGIVTGTNIICTGSADVLTASATGGSWSSSNGNVSVSATGVISGVANGGSTISYTVTNSCGSDYATHAVTAYTTPLAGAISGASAICTGANTLLTNATGSPGGAWSSSSAATATVGSAGMVTGLSTGTAVISYIVTTGCGTAIATKTVTVNAPDAGSIAGITTLCIGGTSSLSSGIAGGTWSSSAPSVVAIGSTGITNALASGNAVISYSASGTCGMGVATVNFTVGSLPVVSPISGVTALCLGGNTNYTDATSGGTWSSSNPAVATIGSAGTVAAISAGTSVISYMITAGCGTGGVTATVNVQTTPVAGSITGSAAVCAGATTILAATGTGTWSSSNILIATAGSAGTITGLAAGTATITYTVTNTCGSATASKNISVETLFSGSITGTSGLCPANTTALSATVPGGVWSSSTPSVATIGSAGTVTAIAAGSPVFSYAVTNSCGTAVATHTLTIYPVPVAGIITGAASLCAGASAIYTNSGVPIAIGSGVWNSSNILVATAGSTGNVTGIAQGSATITYTVANSCGADTAYKNISVDILSAGTVAGIDNICPGNSTTLTTTVPGGTWSSGAPSIAAVGSTGIVTALASGTSFISYAVTNSCGTAIVTHNINVYTPPNAGAITGASLLCTGASTTYATSGTGGGWSSSNTLIATVGTTGTVAGIAPGTAIISYTAANTCTTVSAVKNITVNVLTAGVINGITTLCAGSSTTLSSSITGGTWSSSTPSVATIGSTGSVTAIAPGNTIITYTVSGLCGTAIATANVAVGTLPVVSSITGIATICKGSTTTLADLTGNGVWSSSDPSVAVIDSVGSTTGIAAGTATISYLVTAGCGTSGSAIIISVEDMPSGGIISGNLSICAGASGSLHETITGGAWASGNQLIAAIDLATGVLAGIAPGTAIISYTITNSCGAATTTVNSTVTTVPFAGVINGVTDICEGAGTALQDAVSGGVWSTANTAVATISNAGAVFGIAAGTAEMSYSVSNTCGTNSALQAITVHPIPLISGIAGPLAVIKNRTVILSNAVAGGKWSSSNVSVAAISQGGVVSGIATGTSVITYGLENSFGCSIDTTAIFTVINDTGSNTPVSYGFGIYPTPTANELTISWYNQAISNAQMMIFDIAGKEVFKTPIGIAVPNGSVHVNVLALPPGMYTYNIKSVTGEYTGKLVVIK